MRYEEERQKKKKSSHKKRQVRLRRHLALLVLVMAFIMAGLAAWAKPSMAFYAWGGAAAVLVIEAVMMLLPRGVPAPLYALMALLSIALMALGVVSRQYMVSDRGLMPTQALITELRVTDQWPEDIDRYLGLESLDMKGSTLTDFTPIYSMYTLKSLDVRENTAFTQSDYDALREALPGCDILWSMEVAGQYYDSDTAEIDLTDREMTANQIKALQREYPDIEFTYAVSLMGKAIPQDTQTLDLSGAESVDPGEILSALTMLPDVETVDLRGTPLSVDVVETLYNGNDRVRFLCTYEIPGGAMDSQAESVTLPGGTYEDLRAAMAFIPYMPALQTMDARGIAMNAAELQALQADPNAAKLIYNFAVYGQAVNTLTTTLNLDGIDVGGLEQMELVLKALPHLTDVSMLRCGLSQPDMIALCESHPDIHFLWEVTFGQYTLRTDATAFTTNLYADNKNHYTSETFQPLKYCTDLQMLDLGHCDITDIGFIANMEHLKVLILADNEITDISVLSNLKELEYIELFLNKIVDFSPLADHKALLDLNIYYNPIGDLTPLTTCTRLERLWLGQCGLSNSQIAALRKVLPNCKINAQGSASTGKGWREHKRYTTLREMYNTGAYIPFT